jgi:hypothetical protein
MKGSYEQRAVGHERQSLTKHGQGFQGSISARTQIEAANAKSFDLAAS